MARTSISSKVILLDQLKRERDDIDAQIKDLQSDIIDALDSKGEKSLVVDLDDRAIRATKVQSVRTVIDENTLKKSLGEKVWMKVSTRILDKKKLEAYIATGEVDPMIVAECSTETPSSPYIKIT